MKIKSAEVVILRIFMVYTMYIKQYYEHILSHLPYLFHYKYLATFIRISFSLNSYNFHEYLIFDSTQIGI